MNSCKKKKMEILEEPKVLGHWIKSLVLGSGSFGVVSLWKNQNTNESIAIKKCKLITTLNTRQRQRWVDEVDFMKRIDHPNIVQFKELPPELGEEISKYNPSRLPLLSMEYCTKGNLRTFLKHPVHCSGLQERDVRNILTDITAAISYLHSLDITHRDLKPENIVLQQRGDDRIVYKIIDLGYAKNLNLDAIMSFVGTMDYAAPEIFKTEEYNYSVDYWSLGIITFEIICGVLPFTSSSPVERYKLIKNKNPDTICMRAKAWDNVIYSSELYNEIYISSCLKQDVEIWLRQLLQYDPRERIKRLPNNLDVFEFAKNFLEKTILNVFSVYTLENYTYEINDSTLVGTLKDWIARDTRVNRAEQVLITSLFRLEINDEDFVSDIIGKDRNVFIYKKGAFTNKEMVHLPKYIQDVFNKSINKMTKKQVQSIFVKCIFFINKECNIIRQLTCALNSLRLFYKQWVSEIRAKYETIETDYLNIFIKLDCYLNIRNAFQLNHKSDENMKNCLATFGRLISSLTRCQNFKADLMRNINVLLGRQCILEKYLPKIEMPTEDGLRALIFKATTVWQKTSQESKTDVMSADMSKVLSEIIKVKDKLVHNKKIFDLYAKAVSVALKDLLNLVDWMKDFLAHIAKLSRSFDENQINQYKIINQVDINYLLNVPLVINALDTKDLLEDNVILTNELKNLVDNLHQFCANRIAL